MKKKILSKDFYILYGILLPSSLFINIYPEYSKLIPFSIKIIIIIIKLIFVISIIFLILIKELRNANIEFFIIIIHILFLLTLVIYIIIIYKNFFHKNIYQISDVNYNSIIPSLSITSTSLFLFFIKKNSSSNFIKSKPNNNKILYFLVIYFIFLSFYSLGFLTICSGFYLFDYQRPKLYVLSYIRYIFKIKQNFLYFENYNFFFVYYNFTNSFFFYKDQNSFLLKIINFNSGLLLILVFFSLLVLIFINIINLKIKKIKIIKYLLISIKILHFSIILEFFILNLSNSAYDFYCISFNYIGVTIYVLFYYVIKNIISVNISIFSKKKKKKKFFEKLSKKTNNFYRNLKISFLFFIIIGIIQMNGLFISKDNDFAKKKNLEESLLFFEKSYTREKLNPIYGIDLQQGYPQYLFSICDMYLSLYQIYNNDYYLEIAYRIKNTILRHMSEEFTWKSITTGKELGFYNNFAIHLFLDLYDLSNNEEYLNLALNISIPLIQKYNSSFISLDPKTVNNDKFHSFTALTRLICYNINYNKTKIYNYAQFFYNFSISQFNSENFLWYYNGVEMEKKIYDSHSAFYQMGNSLLFFRYYTYIEEIFPQKSLFLYNNCMNMYSIINKSLNEDFTFKYNQKIESYTESIANYILWNRFFEKLAYKNYSDTIMKASNILIKRQLKSGAFLNTNSTQQKTDLWYNDNIGKSISLFFLIS